MARSIAWALLALACLLAAASDAAQIRAPRPHDGMPRKRSFADQAIVDATGESPTTVATMEQRIAYIMALRMGETPTVPPALVDPLATTQPPATQPATTQPATTQPATTLPDTTQPPTTQPDTTQPATTQPATTQPATTLPATTAPPTTQADTTAPPTTAPDTTAPSNTTAPPST